LQLDRLEHLLLFPSHNFLWRTSARPVVQASDNSVKCHLLSLPSWKVGWVFASDRSRKQLAVVIYRIRTQRNKIESMSLMMQRRDKEFFEKTKALS
jgi:hypothetical protein